MSAVSYITACILFGLKARVVKYSKCHLDWCLKKIINKSGYSMLRMIMDYYWANFILKKSSAMEQRDTQFCHLFWNHGRTTWIFHFTFHFTWSAWYAKSSMSVSMPLGIEYTGANMLDFICMYVFIYCKYISKHTSICPLIKSNVSNKNMPLRMKRVPDIQCLKRIKGLSQSLPSKKCSTEP